MLIAPVGMNSIGWMAPFDPSRMIGAFPDCFSICPTAQIDGLAAFPF